MKDDFSDLGAVELPAHQEHDDFSDLGAVPAPPADPGFGPTADGSLRNPLKVDWLGAIKHEFTKPRQPGEMSVGDNPLLMLSSPAGVGGAAASAIEGTLSAGRNLLERAATSPLPSKIAEATNVTGHAKGLVGKFMPMMRTALPESAQSIADAVTGAIGRKAAYSNPVTGIPQGISDVAKIAEKGQKGLTWALDSAPQIGEQASKVAGVGAQGAAGYQSARHAMEPGDGGKKVLDSSLLVQRLSGSPKAQRFAGLIQNAAANGGDRLASMHFILSQTEPDYQKAVQGD